MSEAEPTIFIIDDEQIQLTLMEKLLSQLPVEIRAYTDPEEAWDDLSKYEPQIVLLDLNMPKLDGQSWMVRLSEQRKMNDFHLVVVTANTMDEEAEFGLYSMGAMEVLRKPLDVKKALALLEELLKEAP